MLSVLLNAALMWVILMIGAFAVGILQSLQINKKFNLQGMDKKRAIQKAANVLVQEWSISKESEARQKAIVVAQRYLEPLGFDKKAIEFQINDMSIDYRRFTKTNGDETWLLLLVHLVLFHYAKDRVADLQFNLTTSDADMTLVLSAVRDARKSYSLF